MDTIGLWIVAAVVAWSLAAPVGFVLYLAYQTWFGEISDDDEI